MKKLLFILLTLSLNSFGQTAGEYYNKGISKFNIKDYSGAIVDFNNAIQLKPEYADAYTYRGVAKYYLKDMNGACKDWTKAGELGSAIALTNIQKFCIQDVGQTAEEYYNKGISKYNLKDYSGAIADYNKAIQLNPDNANYFYGRGNAKHNFQDYSGALKDFDKAIQLKPDNNALSYNKRGLAKIYYPEYRFDEPWSKDLPTAIDDINKAIQQSPDFSDAYFNRGLAKNFKHMDGDCADWSKAEELGHAEAWTWIQNYCKKTAEEYYNKGISKFNIKDYTGAIAAYNKAIQLKPDYADAYYYRGTAKYYLQDYTGAMIDYNQAIQLKPDNANAYSARGTVKYYLQDMNGACADWSKAVELGYAQASTYIQNYCKQIVEAAEAEAQAARFEAAEKSASIIGKPFKLGGFEVAQNDFGTQMEWDQANEACNSLGRGWRLPTEEELNKIYVSLAKKKRGGFSSTIYWSSSLHRDALYNSVLGAKFQDFKISGWGQRDWNAKRNPHSVRAVRTL